MKLGIQNVSFGHRPMAGNVINLDSSPKTKPDNVPKGGVVLPGGKKPSPNTTQPFAGKVIPKSNSNSKTIAALIVGGIILAAGTLYALFRNDSNNKQK